MSEIATSLYPVFLDIAHAPALVVGGGAVAARKTAKLLAAGAVVTVVAPHFCHKLLAMQKQTRKYSRLRLARQSFRAAYLENQRLVFAATDKLSLNARIANICKRRGILVNAAAPSNAGNFSVPATVQRQQFCVAISTGGASIHLSRLWQQRLKKLIGPEWGDLTALLAIKRRQILSSVASVTLRKRIFAAICQPKFAALIRRKGINAASQAIDRIIRGSCKTPVIWASRP